MKTSDTTATLFSEVGMLIKSRMQKVVALPFSQCQTLWFIAEKSGHASNPSMQDIAKHFKIRAPSATFLVDELVRGGLITRHPNEKDRRRVEVALTPAGKKAYKNLEEKRKKILGHLFGKLPEKDRDELNRILTNIIKDA